MTYTMQELRDLPEPETKEVLFERMAVASDALEALIAGHREADLSRPLEKESGWSAKDYLAHLMVWERSIVSLLQKTDRIKEMGLDRALWDSGDFDVQNDALYQNHKERPLKDILEELRETHSQLLALLEALPEDDFQAPYVQFQPQMAGDGEWVNNPIIGWIVGDTYSHYAEHVLDIGRLLTEAA